MNCSTLRRNRLAADHPALPPDEASHLAGCPACNAWHGRLVRLERRLPSLPVPACPVPPDLLAQIRTSPLRLARHHAHPRNVQGGRQKLALAFSLAASLAVFSVGWWAWPQFPPDRPAVAVDDGIQRQIARIDAAPTPSARAGAVVDLADEWLAEARRKADDPARLAVLAGRFDRLVEKDLMQHVRQVSPGERRLLAARLADRLGQVESEASRLAVEWRSGHATAAASLRRIAASAREADRRLRVYI